MRLALFALLTAVPTLAQSPADSLAARADDRSTWAPTAQGVHLLGGSASIDRYGYGNGRTLSAQVAPRIGRFVRDGLAVSLLVGLDGSRTSGTVFPDTQETAVRTGSVGVSAGPEVTQYLGAPGARVFPFVGASVFGRISWSGSVRGDEPVERDTYETLYGQLRAGVMVPIARNVGIEVEAHAPALDVIQGRFERSFGVSAGIATFLY